MGPDPYTLNCADGLLDLRTQSLRPHDAEALCTKVTAWRYDDTTTTGAWERHLKLCLPDPDVRRQVQRDLGRALVEAVLEESLPIWWGSGANGKSTTQSALLHGIGAYGKRSARDLLVKSSHDRHPTELADLAGARLVFSEEVESGRNLAEALVKDLTGGGLKVARFCGRDFFSFEQSFSIFLLTNHRPTIAGTDEGIWRRIRLVPWTVEIPLSERRPQDEIVADLVADGAWMLRWMVAGFADWQRAHAWVAEQVLAATAEYRAAEDRLGGFLDECCDREKFAIASAVDLFAAYVDHCIAEGREQMTKTAFGKALAERGLTSKKGAHGARVWQGIRLRVARGGAFSGSLQEDPT